MGRREGAKEREEYLDVPPRSVKTRGNGDAGGEATADSLPHSC